MAAFAVAAPVLGVPPADDSAQHCPDKDNENKVEANSQGDGTTTINGVVITSDGNTLTFTNNNLASTAVVSWCAKGGRQFTGAGDTDANYNTGLQSTTLGAGGTATVTFNAGKNVSYFIPYLVTLTQEEEPIEVSPEVTVVPPTCDEDGSFILTEIDGVTYVVPDWDFGKEFTITTTLDEGYVLADDAVGSFDITVLAKLTGEQCADEGEIAIFKTMCDSIGQQDTCNGRDTSLDNYKVDFRIYAGDDDEGESTIATVTLSENAEGQGNTGAGSQGRILVDGLVPGTYTVCEIPVAYLGDVQVPLDAFPRPEAGNGGSTGGSQTQLEGTDCIVVTVTNGTAEVKFLDLVEEEEEDDTATIEVDKVVTGTGASGTEEFEISVTGEEDFDLSANDEAESFLVELDDGTYAVDETLTEEQEDAGWTLTSIVCTSDEYGEVDETEFTLEAGETVTCVITNAFQAPVQLGSITIVKDASPNAAQDFAYTVTGTGLSIFSLDDDADGALPNSQTFSGLAPGAYTVTEVPAGGWTVTSITCSAGGAADGSNSRQANITLVAGAHVTCTFLNTQDAVVPTPTLVIDKVASTETITITGAPGALVASPSVVTWTLTYTLTNGPVNAAVITDPVPAGFTFLDASNGGTLVGNTVTWNLGTLSASGSVTFRTTVDPVTVARALVTNTATIDSTETAPDTGQDGVTVSQSGTQGSVSTPSPTPVVRTGTATSTGVPNTATSADAGLTAAAILGALMLLSAGVFVSAAIGGRRRLR